MPKSKQSQRINIRTRAYNRSRAQSISTPQSHEELVREVRRLGLTITPKGSQYTLNYVQIRLAISDRNRYRKSFPMAVRDGAAQKVRERVWEHALKMAEKFPEKLEPRETLQFRDAA